MALLLFFCFCFSSSVSFHEQRERERGGYTSVTNRTEGKERFSIPTVSFRDEILGEGEEADQIEEGGREGGLVEDFERVVEVRQRWRLRVYR